MKETEVCETIAVATKWRTISCYIWCVPLVYYLQYLAPVLSFEIPSAPSLPSFIKSYGLFAGLLTLKYFTFTNFAEVSKSSDAIRKLFTNMNAFHSMLIGSVFLYPLLYREVMNRLGYAYYGDSHTTFYASGLGVLSGITYIIRHEHVNYWYCPPYARTRWLAMQAPSLFVKSVLFSGISYLILEFLWLVTHMSTGSSNNAYGRWAAGLVVYYIENLLVSVMMNFLAKPIRLDDENSIGEQYAISGLNTKDSSINFHCFQDLLRVARSDPIRRRSILDPKTYVTSIQQWNILLSKGIEYITSISQKIRNYNLYKVTEHKTSNQDMLQQLNRFIYYIFNDPPEVKFRNELFSQFTLAALCSNTLTSFLINANKEGYKTYVLRDNSLGLVLQTQAECLIDLYRYSDIDSELNCKYFIQGKVYTAISLNMSDLGKEYREYLSALSIRGECLELLEHMINTDS